MLDISFFIFITQFKCSLIEVGSVIRKRAQQTISSVQVSLTGQGFHSVS